MKPSINRLLSIWKGLALNDRWSDTYVKPEDIETFSKRTMSEGPEFYARELSKLRKDFLLSLETGQFSTTARFGRKRNSVLPRFLYDAFVAVFTDDGVLRSVVNVDAVTCVNQLTAVFTKIRGGHTPESETATIATFIRAEMEMEQWQMDLDTKITGWLSMGNEPVRVVRPLGEILRIASNHIKRVLSGSDPRDISPKHGSGVAACGTPKWGRYAVPRYVAKIDSVWPMSEYYFASPTAFCDGLHEYMRTPEYDPCAKVLLVPKDSRGPRLISCEPRETMWIQQGLMSRLYQDIEGHSLTRGLVNFTDQTFNQLAAFLGSQDHGTQYIENVCALEGGDFSLASLSLTAEQREAVDSWHYARLKTAMYFEDAGLFPASRGDVASPATLDLSNASDMLHLNVVEALFPGNWVEALKACRSSRTKLPDGRTMTLHKHAPMGSAVCFPVMALVIWSVLTAIAPAHAVKHLLVYGDDIVVPSYMAEDAMRVLEAIGFVVNRNKSFYKGPFRESCGEEFFRGCRVTPVYLRENPDDDTRSKMCMFAFCNNLLQSAACADNTWMMDLLDEWYGNKYPIQLLAKQYRANWFGQAEHMKLACRHEYSTLTGVVYTNDPNKVRLPSGRRGTRWDRHLQVRFYCVQVPEPQYHEYDTDDWSHVLRSLAEPRKATVTLRREYVMPDPDVQAPERLGRDPIHNRVRYVYRWCQLQ